MDIVYSMADCIFCKIVKRELPAEVIYEDNYLIALLDIFPVNYGHTLVCPKEHYANLLSTPENVLEKMVVTSKHLAQAVVKSMGADGFNLLVNNGTAAGQEVDHVHLHIMPRNYKDGQKFGFSKKRYSEREMKQVGEAIRKFLK